MLCFDRRELLFRFNFRAPKAHHINGVYVKATHHRGGPPLGLTK
jgi:hypothetical protein